MQVYVKGYVFLKLPPCTAIVSNVNTGFIHSAQPIMGSSIAHIPLLTWVACSNAYIYKT